MKFLLTAFGSYGDVHPMMGLGVELAARGHAVTLIANPYFEEEIAARGLNFLPAGTREDYLKLTEHPGLWHPWRSLQVVFRYGVAGLLESTYEQIVEHYAPGETVIAAHGLDAASRVAHDKLGAPVAAVVYAPMALASAHQAPKVGGTWIGPGAPRWLNRLQFWLGDRLVVRKLVAPTVNEFRRRLGLAPVEKFLPEWWYGTGCNLCLFPDWFAPPAPDWPPEVHCVGFPLWDGGGERSLSEPAESFLEAGPPPVVFTPGTANRQAAGFFLAAVDACERMGRRGVLLSKFQENLPHGLPPSVVGLTFEPLSELLPRAAAFVHHGGVGSCSQGLAAGVPHLVRPLAFDQHDNAARLVRLGVAEELYPRRFTGARAAAALGRLLEDPRVRENAGDVAARMDGRRARGAACDVLEELARAPAAR